MAMMVIAKIDFAVLFCSSDMDGSVKVCISGVGCGLAAASFMYTCGI